MLRMFIPVLLMVIFAAWVLYRLLIEKGLKRNLTNLYLGLTFSGMWLLICFVLLKM